jgi:hypothetical protein
LEESVVEDETGTYGLTDENSHIVDDFRADERPMVTFKNGVALMGTLVALYRSAEIRQTGKLPAAGLEMYVPQVARGGRSRAEEGAVAAEPPAIGFVRRLGGPLRLCMIACTIARR